MNVRLTNGLRRSNVNDVDDNGMTALSVGARIANAPMVNVLLKKRASVHTHDDHGATPLHHAAFAGGETVSEHDG